MNPTGRHQKDECSHPWLTSPSDRYAVALERMPSTPMQAPGQVRPRRREGSYAIHAHAGSCHLRSIRRSSSILFRTSRTLGCNSGSASLQSATKRSKFAIAFSGSPFSL